MQSQMQETPPFLWSQVFFVRQRSVKKENTQSLPWLTMEFLRRFTEASQSPSHARLLHWSFFKVFCWISHIQSARLLITKNKIQQQKNQDILLIGEALLLFMSISSYCRNGMGPTPMGGKQVPKAGNPFPGDRSFLRQRAGSQQTNSIGSTSWAITTSGVPGSPGGDCCYGGVGSRSKPMVVLEVWGSRGTNQKMMKIDFC